MVAVAVWLFRNRLKSERHRDGGIFAGFDLLQAPRFGFGALCIFLYVGAEVAIGSLIVNYLHAARRARHRRAGRRQADPCSTGAARWSAGSSARRLLRVISPGKLLASVAIGAIALILLFVQQHGHPRGLLRCSPSG